MIQGSSLRERALEVDKTRFEYQIHHFLPSAFGPVRTCLKWSFPICTMGRLIPPIPWGCCEVRWDYAHEALNGVYGTQ